MPPNHATVLRRGAACSACRDKKLKCDARTPTCSNCLKALDRVCFYDVSKRSKVAQLEYQIAQLERALAEATLEDPVLQPQRPVPWPPMHLAYAPAHAEGQTTRSSDLTDFSTMSLSGSEPAGAGSTSSGTVYSSAPPPGPPLEHSHSRTPLPSPYHLTTPPLHHVSTTSTPRSALSSAHHTPSAPLLRARISPPFFDDHLAAPPLPQPPSSELSRDRTRHLFDAPPYAGRRIGWGNPGEFELDLPDDELPKDMATHLYSVFFSRLLISGVLHPPTLYTSLHLPSNHPQRPHPSLLFAVYACAARLSPDPSIPPLQDAFLARALEYVGRAIGTGEKPLNVLQAYSVLSVNAYGRSQISSAWAYNGAGIKLAVSLGLHRLTAAKLAAAQRDPHFSADRMRSIGFGAPGQKVVLMKTPSDPRDQALALACFWGFYCAERSGSIVCMWPVGIEEHEISTCFWVPGMDGTFGPSPIFRTSTLQDPDIFTSHPPSYDSHAFLIKSITLCARASRINDSLPRACRPPPCTADLSSASPSAPPDGLAEERERLHIIRHSAEFAQLDKLIDTFRRSLPPRLTSPPKAPFDGWPFAEPRRITALTATYMATLLLHEIHVDTHPESARACASAAAAIVQLVSQLASPKFNLGQLHIYISLCWMRAGQQTLRVLKDAQLAGARERVEGLKNAVLLVIGALDRFGDTWPFGRFNSQALEKALGAALGWG